MNIQTVATTIFDKILDIIEGEEYGLSEHTLFQLKLLRNTTIYTTDTLPEKIILHDMNDIPMAVYEPIRRSSQVIDPVPIFQKNEIIILKPVVVLPSTYNKPKDIWIITHELCHLLSVGRYIQNSYDKNKWFHSFGLNKYEYSSSNGKIILISKKESFYDNEILNDAITWHFIELILEHDAEPPDKYIKSVSIKLKSRDDIKKIIGFYFSGQVDSLASRLSVDNSI